MLSFRRRARSSQFSDREQAYAVALSMVGIVLVTVATVAILMEDTARESALRMRGPPSFAGPTPDRLDARPALDVSEYVNGARHSRTRAVASACCSVSDRRATWKRRPAGRSIPFRMSRPIGT